MDIYLHDLSDEDLTMLEQTAIRKEMIERGVMLKPHAIGLARNQLVRWLIRREAAIERDNTAGYRIIQKDQVVGLPMLHWVVPLHDKLRLIVLKADAKECELWLKKNHARFQRMY